MNQKYKLNRGYEQNQSEVKQWGECSSRYIPPYFWVNSTLPTKETARTEGPMAGWSGQPGTGISLVFEPPLLSAHWCSLNQGLFTTWPVPFHWLLPEWCLMCLKCINTRTPCWPRWWLACNLEDLLSREPVNMSNRTPSLTFQLFDAVLLSSLQPLGDNQC